MSDFHLGLVGNEQVLPVPKTFRIEPQQITRDGRTASGRLVKDVIAVKNRFVLAYTGLTAAQAEILRTEYARNQFLSFKYPDRGQERTATVWFSELPRELRYQLLSHWNNVTITLDEQ
jgi:hypothetical protein